ncbi:4-carboxymuconolactone decarboxylase [uncultured Marinobacter sp.]|uniref:4-carboxymuconolactone decarboxylase n=1 Tax=uncultured Marinobacter sp. TaxID=187379 RepID=UPI0025CFA83D|nr:4-carboxymuconolactone decarboxylase [uncultured Marinobacter sp.]
MSDERFERGLNKRRKVLGNEHVERSMKNADDFSQPLQELVTEYCWGNVWQRDGLSDRDRSVINLAMLTALNRSHELRLHVRGAINNGMRVEEIREVLMQTAIYCGIPAAIDAFRQAREVLVEMGEI